MLRVCGGAPFFVQPYRTSEASGLVTIVLGAYAVVPLGFLHYLLAGHPGLLCFGTAVLLAAIVLLFRGLARVQPAGVEAV